MGKINKLIKKIRKFLKKIFYSKNNLLLEESNQEQENILSDIENNNKQEFFEMYENIKKGIISLDDLMITDLLKVLSISQEELNIDDNNINSLENELFRMDKECDLLRMENKILNNVLNT